MKPSIRWTLAGIGVLSLTLWCVSTRAPAPLNAHALAQRIVVGQTTKTELDAAFGAAPAVKFGSGDDIWVYQDRAADPASARRHRVATLLASAMSSRAQELVILFDRAGVVKKYRLHAQPG